MNSCCKPTSFLLSFRIHIPLPILVKFSSPICYFYYPFTQFHRLKPLFISSSAVFKPRQPKSAPLRVRTMSCFLLGSEYKRLTLAFELFPPTQLQLRAKSLARYDAKIHQLYRWGHGPCQPYSIQVRPYDALSFPPVTGSYCYNGLQNHCFWLLRME